MDIWFCIKLAINNNTQRSKFLCDSVTNGYPSGIKIELDFYLKLFREKNYKWDDLNVKRQKIIKN